jgi:hypothetical protein
VVGYCLSSAVEIAFPEGGMTASGSERDFTALAEIDAMREKCRIKRLLDAAAILKQYGGVHRLVYSIAALSALATWQSA